MRKVCSIAQHQPRPAQRHDEALVTWPGAELIAPARVRPRIVIGSGGDLDRVRRLVERAHQGCFIANTLNSEILIEPVIEHAG